MNVRIRYVYGLLVLLFALLIGFPSYWSVFDAEGLEANNANRRVLLEEQQVRRGLIFARDGTVLARNRVTGRGQTRFFKRRQALGVVVLHHQVLLPGECAHRRERRHLNGAVQVRRVQRLHPDGMQLTA